MQNTFSQQKLEKPLKTGIRTASDDLKAAFVLQQFDGKKRWFELSSISCIL